MAESTADTRFPLLPKLIATSFGAGFWPWGPGTAGAVVGLLLWMPVALIPSVWGAFGLTCGLITVFTALGVWSATVAERHWGPDPSRVVMDETVGQWITMLPLCSLAGAASWHDSRLWIGALISLILFRFFDIVKPLGVRRMEALPSGWGVMADDILAGIYGGICMLLILNLWLI